MSSNTTNDQPCAFCSHPFDHDALGAYGCPNCCGDGLDDETAAEAEYSAQETRTNIANYQIAQSAGRVSGSK